MKVIKPIEVVRDTYTDVNTRDIVPAWNSGTTYGSSSTFDKVWVQYQGTIYESIKPVNLNNIPSSSSTWWRTITTLTTDDFAFEAWSSGTTYSTGQIVYYQTSATAWPKYYQSLQNSNLNKIPPDNLIGTTPFWLDLGYTNTSKLYDIETNTQTITTDELITTFTARKCTSGGIFGAQGNRVLLTAKSERNLYSINDWNTTAAVDTSTPTLNAMVFAPDKNILLLCGNSGFLKYSKDNGTTWNYCTTPATAPNLKTLAYSKENSVFIAAGTSNDLSTAILWKSLDGVTWTNIAGLPTASVSLNKAIWIKQLNKFVIAASNGNIYTADGTATTWIASSVGGGIADLVGIVYNPANGLVHVIGNSVLRYTNDLINWTGLAFTNNARDIAVVNNSDYSTTGSTYQYCIVAGTSGTLSTTHKSSDGITWTTAAVLTGIPTNYVASGVTYCYTEAKWVFNIGGYILTWDGSASTSYTNITPSNNPATNRTKLFYSSSTDTLFFFGNNSALVTSPNIYFKEYSLNSALVDNWYDYFYKDYTLLTEAVFENVPVYTRTRITICVVGDVVRCGIAYAGISSNLGITQYGASAGIIDYSKKETDEFGTTTFIKRAFSKRMNVNLILPSSDLYRIQKILSDIRATPCIWIGSDADIYKSLTMYGYYKDFSLEIPYPEYSYCSLQVEGLTE